MMTDIVISRSLAKKMKAVAGDLPGKMKCNALVARATAVRHGFLGHGLMHGSSDHRSHQNPEAERNTHSSSQLQRPQLQPFSADSATYNFGFNSQARKSNEWLTDSHTRPANSSLAAFGCYRVVGPARISKRGDTLVAHLFRGSRVELLDGHGNATSYRSMESVGEETDLPGEDGSNANSSCCSGDDVDYVAECVLVAAHVELCGSACSVDLVDLSVQHAVHHHNGHTYVSVRNLPPEVVIELDADADLRHPINITPPAAPA
ncbi:hypothetical protein Vretimale_8505 [Volvox reticuliferus]|uniref:Uncharacterized protein n=1 Tax=Volvox reticuliferus TaxID=1737510 RepID=A0A8J4GAZ3_9CHLO|nr:hypothetical protein Vretimale_8505 [Volvox reticuliferus]